MHGFDSIIGHEPVVERLRQAILNGKAGHAYIFSGEPGMGKKTLANAFAKALQCESDFTPRLNGQIPTPPVMPCGMCLSCRVFERANHPDVHYVSGTKTKSIGVDDVREQILRPMRVKPFRYRYAVFLVEGAETLTPAAQNALLKTIEEPAPYGVFLFLAAHTNAFLPTVLSRCVVFRLKPLSDDRVQKALTLRGIPEDKADFCAAFARGNIGKALDMAASEDFLAMRELALEVTFQIRRMDLTAAFAMYRRFEKWKESIQSLLDMLYLCYRDLITCKGTNGTQWLSQRDYQPEFAHAAKGTDMKTLFHGIDAITDTKRILRQNGNFQLAVELLLLKLAGHAA